MTAALPQMTFFHEYFFERKVWETQRNALSRWGEQGTRRAKLGQPSTPLRLAISTCNFQLTTFNSRAVAPLLHRNKKSAPRDFALGGAPANQHTSTLKQSHLFAHTPHLPPLDYAQGSACHLPLKSHPFTKKANFQPSTFNFQPLCSHIFLLRNTHHQITKSSALTFFYCGKKISTPRLRSGRRNSTSAPLGCALGKH